MTSKGTLLRSTRLIAALFPVLLIPLAGCSSDHEHKEKESIVAPLTVQAPVVTVQTDAVANNYEALGTVASKVTASISSKVVGVVKTANFEAGDIVASGKLLIEIDQTEITAKLRRAHSCLLEVKRELDEVDSEIKAAQFARAAADSRKTLEEQTFRRYDELRQRQSVSAQEFDDASARLKASSADFDKAEQAIKSLAARREGILAKIDERKAAVSEVESQLGYLTIAAPFSGLVTQKSVNVGDLAAPGTVLLKLEKEDYRLEVPVDESAINDVTIGGSVPASLGVKQVHTTVVEIVPKADPQSRSFTVKLRLPAGCGARSGMYGKAMFPLRARRTIAVPAKSLIESGQLTYVFTIDSTGIARMRVVKTGHVYGDNVEILSGLSKGDRIVSSSVPTLTDGMKVETRNQ